MMPYRLAAWTLLVGSLIFLFAAFNPSSMAVFPAATPEARLAAIQRYRSLWVISQVAFGLGAVIAALGYVLLARALGDRAVAMALPRAAALGMLFGALLWGINLVQRATDFTGFAQGTQPAWPFVIYTLLTIAGLAVWGWIYLQSGFPGWLGWATIGLAAVVLVLFVALRDMPPFVYYVISLLAVDVLFFSLPG